MDWDCGWNKQELPTVVYRIVVLICTDGSSTLTGTSLCMLTFEIGCFRRSVLA